MLGNVDHIVSATLNHCDAASQRSMSAQKRDTPRKCSEPTPSSARTATTAAASISCPAGFTIPAEPDPVCVLCVYMDIVLWHSSINVA